MLRLRPSVISVTMAEVKELETRRRFQKYLEQEDVYTQNNTTETSHLEVPLVQVDPPLISLGRWSLSTRSSTDKHDKQCLPSFSSHRKSLLAGRSLSQPVAERRIEEDIIPGLQFSHRQESRDFASADSEASDQQNQQSGARWLSERNPPNERPTNMTPEPVSTPPSNGCPTRAFWLSPARQASPAQEANINDTDQHERNRTLGSRLTGLVSLAHAALAQSPPPTGTGRGIADDSAHQSQQPTAASSLLQRSAPAAGISVRQVG